MSVAASAGDGYSAGPRQRFSVPAARRRAPQLPRAALRPHPPAAPRRPDLPGAPPDVGNRRESSHVGHRWSAVATTRLCGPASARCSTKRQPVSCEPAAHLVDAVDVAVVEVDGELARPSARPAAAGCGSGRSRSRRAAGGVRARPRPGSGAAGRRFVLRVTSSARGWPPGTTSWPARQRRRPSRRRRRRRCGRSSPAAAILLAGDRGDVRQLDDGRGECRVGRAPGRSTRTRCRRRRRAAGWCAAKSTAAARARRARPGRPRSRRTRSPAARRRARRSPAAGPRPSAPARSCQAG